MTSSEAIPPAYGVSSRAVLRVSLVFLLTGFVTFLCMGLLGGVMRLDHAGWWEISADWFYRIMTIHGAGMVGGMLMAAMGAMSAALARTVTLQARWLWISYFIYSLSIVFLLYAVLIGGFAGGWTALDPLPFKSLDWDVWAGVMMYLAFLAIALGFAAYCLHLLLAVRARFGGISGALAWRYLFSRGPVDPGQRIPNATEVAGAATSIIGLITAVAGAAVLIPLFLNAAGVTSAVDALYSKNLIMLFGHAIANNTMYISVGVVYALLPVFTHRAGHMNRLIVLAWNLTIVLVIAPIPHHLYQDFSQPFGLHVLGQVASWAIAPEVLLITIIGSMAHIFRSGMKWTVPSILVVLGFWGWVFGGLAAIIDASIAINNLTHNTLWVPGHFHTYYLLGTTSFVWAYLFYLIGDLGRVSEWATSRFAAGIYGVGGVGFVLMFFFSAADSVPRRYARHLVDWQIWAQIAVPFVALITIALTWLIADMLRGLAPAWRGIAAPPDPQPE